MERRNLEKIARDKEERLRLLQQQEEEAEKERLKQNAIQREQRQKLFEESEREMERIR